MDILKFHLFVPSHFSPLSDCLDSFRPSIVPGFSTFPIQYKGSHYDLSTVYPFNHILTSPCSFIWLSFFCSYPASPSTQGNSTLHRRTSLRRGHIYIPLGPWLYSYAQHYWQMTSFEEKLIIQGVFLQLPLLLIFMAPDFLLPIYHLHCHWLLFQNVITFLPWLKTSNESLLPTNSGHGIPALSQSAGHLFSEFIFCCWLWGAGGAKGTAGVELAVTQGWVSVIVCDVPGRYHILGDCTLEE